MLSPDRLERLRNELKAEQARLKDVLAGEIEDSDLLANRDNIGVGNHLADDATMAFDQAATLSLRRNHEWTLGEVEDALERIDEGTYGICERCGREIDFARLKAKPWARLDMACQRLVEQQ
jgi:RNA polymerase-binding transcription factor DksA